MRRQKQIKWFYDAKVTGGETTCEPDPIPHGISVDNYEKNQLDQVLLGQHPLLQVLQQDRPRPIQRRKHGDDITFKLDCLKCDQSYTFEVWAVDKEDHMWEDQKVLVTEAIFSQGPHC